MSQKFEYRHIVHFDETNVVGNVYFANYLMWQGRCREEFLRLHAPELLAEFRHGLSLVTSQCSCSFARELFAFDQVVVQMELKSLAANRMVLAFEYLKEGPEGRELVATGQQELVCMRRAGEELEACSFPSALVEALRPYGLQQSTLLS